MLAAVVLLMVVRAATDSAMVHLARGNNLMRAELFEQAAAEFRAAIRQNPGLREAQLNLAISDFELRDYEPARTLFLALAKSEPIATYYLGRIDLLAGNLDSAIAHLRAASAAPNKGDAKYYFGVALFEKLQFSEAAAVFRQCIEENPRDFRAHQRLARCLRKLGREQEAAQEFARTSDLHDYYTEGSVALRSCEHLITTGDGNEAWAQCSRLADTDDVDKLVALGMTLGRHGDAAHARVVWQRALALDPESPEINYNLGLSCFQLRDMSCGRAHAGKAVSLWPDFPEANVLYGTILYMLADDTGAQRVLRHAQELRPDDAMVQRLLSELRAR